MITLEEHKQIALTILEQLGGRKFMAMTGVESVIALNDTKYGGAQIRFKGCRHANTIRVIVDYSDTYTVEFWKLTRASINPKPLKIWENCYDDMLIPIFEEYTGLKTSLGTLKG